MIIRNCPMNFRLEEVFVKNEIISHIQALRQNGITTHCHFCPLFMSNIYS
jgi:hypothetical protein